MRVEIVSAAERLGLTTAGGALKPLDSLTLLDLVMELEATFSITIPTTMLTLDRFESFDTLAALFEELRPVIERR